MFFVEFDKLNPSTTKHQEKFFHKNDIYKTHSTIMTTATHNWQKAFGKIQFSRRLYNLIFARFSIQDPKIPAGVSTTMQDSKIPAGVYQNARSKENIT